MFYYINSSILFCFTGLFYYIYSAYLHNTVPVVASRHAKERQESHSEIAKVGVFAQSNARMRIGTFYSQTTNTSMRNQR